MNDSLRRSKTSQTEVTGEFLVHETGQSYPYVAKFRKVANDVLWNARVKLGGKWVSVRGGRVRDAGAETDFALSEMVRDSVLDSMYDEEMDARMVAAQREYRRAQVGRRVLAVLALFIAAICVWAWLN